MADTIYKGSAAKMVSSDYLYKELQDLKNKYIDTKGASLSVSGKTVTLKDADGNTLKSLEESDSQAIRCIE